ncbi:hypothetical protein R3P38DRAFT_2966160 [Favolaschia claudopus]|uniref:Uncharacterized protein n=1 Tax=Favolaschia claudopus TaxID=2862362 RepID=A0AAW0B5D4_9AGAR
MGSTALSVRAIVLEQTERTRLCSRVEVARYIADSELKAASLDSQICALIALRDRERVTTQVLKHVASPIHSLPGELLAEIFHLTIRAHQHMRDAFSVAHSAPRLWCGPIEIRTWKRSDEAEQSYLDGLEQWLARSIPLSIPLTLRVGFDLDLETYPTAGVDGGR